MDYNEAFIKGKEKIARVFKDRKHEQGTDQRVPPGQTLTQGFPVLDLGVKPNFDSDTWRLHVYGLVEKEQHFTYNDLLTMPSTSLTADFHCVTRWSKLDVKWKGVLFKDFVALVKPKEAWKCLIQEGMDGYTTNVPRKDLECDNVLLAYELDGKPIPREHGWPLRMIIPHLYGWKGSKFLNGLKFTDNDEPGFWEVRGYHNHGDVLKEERYS